MLDDMAKVRAKQSTTTLGTPGGRRRGLVDCAAGNPHAGGKGFRVCGFVATVMVLQT